MANLRRVRSLWQQALIVLTATAGVAALVAAAVHHRDGATPLRWAVGAVLLGSAGLRAAAMAVSRRPPSRR